MLEIDKDSTIYLTKGDSGVINISLDGDIGNNYSELHFYVRSATQQDNVKIHITSNVNTLPEEDKVAAHSAGSIEKVSENTLENWTLSIAPAATTDLKRGKYVYDFKLTGVGGKGVVTTFVGGGKDKVEFWVT
jgi:hypothetical protein